jgi:ribonuclease R
LEEYDASNNFSLVEGKARRVITVKAVLDENGLVLKYEIYRSIIVVKRRWNYDEVSSADPTPAEFVFLNELTKKRSSNVNYNINLPSVRVTCDTDGRAESIVTENTNDPSHSMVATVMILANLTVSLHIRKQGRLLPNRFHDSLRGFKPHLPVNTGNEHVDSFILVKRFSRAYYSVDERGHFGLGITDYVHFTSPMRRYADVLVHRILAGIVPSNLEALVKWVNHRALVVRSIQDIYINWKVIRWLNENENEKNQTIWVTGVSKSGIMWFMPSLSLNGFIHVSLLEPKQYWNYNEIDGVLEGSRIIKIGDKIDVTVDSIDFIKGVVNLKL